MVQKRIFLTSGTSWQVPQDWNPSNNSVECIGGGGEGGTDSLAGLFASGGGGGEYRKSSNLNLSGVISYSIGQGGSGGGEAGANGTDTNFNSGQIIAKAGLGGNAVGGGAGGTGGTGDVGFDGGNGGSSTPA
jgi:hypothetical protein